MVVCFSAAHTVMGSVPHTVTGLSATHTVMGLSHGDGDGRAANGAWVHATNGNGIRVDMAMGPAPHLGDGVRNHEKR